MTIPMTNTAVYQIDYFTSYSEAFQRGNKRAYVEAARCLLNVYFKSKTTHTESAMLYTVNEILYTETKSEIQEKMKEFMEEK